MWCIVWRILFLLKIRGFRFVSLGLGCFYDGVVFVAVTFVMCFLTLKAAKKLAAAPIASSIIPAM